MINDHHEAAATAVDDVTWKRLIFSNAFPIYIRNIRI